MRKTPVDLNSAPTDVANNILVPIHFVMDQYHIQTVGGITAGLWTILSSTAKDKT